MSMPPRPETISVQRKVSKHDQTSGHPMEQPLYSRLLPQHILLGKKLLKVALSVVAEAQTKVYTQFQSTARLLIRLPSMLLPPPVDRRINNVTRHPIPT